MVFNDDDDDDDACWTFSGIDNTTYEIWSFVLLIAEPFFRPLVYIAFYFRYLMDDPMAY